MESLEELGKAREGIGHDTMLVVGHEADGVEHDASAPGCVGQAVADELVGAGRWGSAVDLRLDIARATILVMRAITGAAVIAMWAFGGGCSESRGSSQGLLDGDASVGGVGGEAQGLAENGGDQGSSGVAGTADRSAAGDASVIAGGGEPSVGGGPEVGAGGAAGESAGKWRCTITFEGQGGATGSQAWSVARDSAMSSIVTGNFFGTVDFGGKVLTSSGYTDIFVGKYSPDCKLIWVERFGGVGTDSGRAVKVDENDDIVVGGVAGQSVEPGGPGTATDLGGGSVTAAGSGAAFLARYDKNGVHQWSHLYSGSGLPTTRDLAFAPNGDIVLVGDGGGNYGGGALGKGTVVARYTSGGMHSWSTLLRYGPSSGVNTGSGAIVVDSAGKLLVSGSYASEVVGGGTNAFLSSVSADGKTTMQLKDLSTIPAVGSASGGEYNTGYAVAVRGDDIVWAGQCMPPVDIGGGALEHVGGGASEEVGSGPDTFLAGYDSLGKHLFSFLEGGPAAAGAFDIALDRHGNIGVVGYAYPLGVVAKYSSDGRLLWTKTFDAYDIRSNAIAGDDSMATVGFFSEPVDLGNGPQSPLDSSDSFLTLYDP